MPVETRSTANQTRAVGLAVLALIIAIAIAWAIIAFSGGGPNTRLQLGDDVFRAGNATRMSKQIVEAGPLLFSDVSGRGQNRPVFLNHFGDDPEQRWVAFDAVAQGAPENCFLYWSANRDLFEERSVTKFTTDAEGEPLGELCRDITFPPNGEGLKQYRWKVDDEGLLTIDFRPEDEAGD